MKLPKPQNIQDLRRRPVMLQVTAIIPGRLLLTSTHVLTYMAN